MPHIQLLKQTETSKFIHTNPPVWVTGLDAILYSPGDYFANIPLQDRVNLFYTLAYHSNTDDITKCGELPSRSSATFLGQSLIPFDIDGSDVLRWAEYAFIFAKHLQVSPDALAIICSGNGLHILLRLANMIRSADYFKKNKPYYIALCEKISSDLKAAGLPHTHDGNEWRLDSTCFEPARVFRLPGTVNRKKGRPDTNCEVLQATKVLSKFDIKELSGLGEIEEKNVSSKEIRRSYPTPDFKHIMQECAFLCSMNADPTQVHEPEFFSATSLLSAMPIDARLESGETARDIATKLFDGAKHSASLAKADFEEKWSQAGKYGAQKCETVNQVWNKCSGCVHFNKVVTPLALKSSCHLSSEANGFWKLSQDGKITEPHYADLQRAYKQTHPYTVTPKGRIFSFKTTHYTECPDLTVEGYLERKCVPSDPVKAAMRREFVSKIKAVGVTDPEVHETLFQDTIRGKLNCRNGILNISTGELTAHSADIGFQYVLPYDYQPGQVSEMFLNWLDTITQSRVELMDTLLDVMAYGLWPSYDDHVFTYLIGQGKNGKSTFIHIMQAIFGKQNFSSVSLPQLAGNRFAPSALEGKLVNLSEESSGSAISPEELNIIKNLSAGGSMRIERKGQDGYEFKNQAKMIFSANTIPKLKEQGTAIKRRLLVIPFDYEIDIPDSNIEKALEAEAPVILSMLVKRIQENITKNAGKFVINRGGAYTEEAQQRFLTAGNTSVEWAREHLITSPTMDDNAYVPVSEAYVNYSGWCKENGHNHVDSKKAFSMILRENFITKAQSLKGEFVWINNSSTRVFRRTIWNQGAPK